MSSKREQYEKLLNNKNIVAALHTIASVEVTDMDMKGYSKLVGGTYITLSSDHPRILVADVNSDACGRYQFLSTTWDEINSRIGPLDFSNPRHQDIACIDRIETRGSLEKIISGDIIGAFTGGYDPSLKHVEGDYTTVCYQPHSGMGCEWAGLYPDRYGQNSHDESLFLETFNKYKDVPLPGADGAPTDDSTTFSAESSSSNTKGFTASIEYGASSIMGFLGDAIREVLPNSMRLAKIMSGNPPKSVSKVMGGPSKLVGSLPGMSTSSTSTGGPLKPGQFTPKPGGFINPLPGAILSSPYGWRWGRIHEGIDLSSTADPYDGKPVMASASGKVIDIEKGCPEIGHEGDGCGGGYGNLVHIEHPNGYSTMYAHLITVNVQMGQEVKQGDIIGIEGMSGRSTGPHLHFEIRNPSGERLNPVDFLPEFQ